MVSKQTRGWVHDCRVGGLGRDHMTVVSAIRVESYLEHGSPRQQPPACCGSYGSAFLPAGPHIDGSCTQQRVPPGCSLPLPSPARPANSPWDPSSRCNSRSACLVSDSLKGAIDSRLSGLAYFRPGPVEIILQALVVLLQPAQLELRHGHMPVGAGVGGNHPELC